MCFKTNCTAGFNSIIHNEFLGVHASMQCNMFVSIKLNYYCCIGDMDELCFII